MSSCFLLSGGSYELFKNKNIFRTKFTVYRSKLTFLRDFSEIFSTWRLKCLLWITKASRCYLLWIESYELFKWTQNLTTPEKSEVLRDLNEIFRTRSFNWFISTAKVATCIPFKLMVFSRKLAFARNTHFQNKISKYF